MNISDFHIEVILPSDTIVSLIGADKDYHVRKYDDIPVVLLWNYWDGLEKGNKKDAERIPIIAKDDKMVDGYKIGTQIVFDKDPDAVIDNLKSSLIPSNIVPFRKIRQEEILNYYQYDVSVEIKGVEVKEYMDVSVLVYDYSEAYPGYIDISRSEKYDEILSLIPEDCKKEVSAGFDPAHDGIKTVVLIKKNQIDKIILKQRFIKPEALDTVLSRGKVDSCYYTGEENTWELSLVNSDPDSLKKMSDLRIIRNVMFVLKE